MLLTNWVVLQKMKSLQGRNKVVRVELLQQDQSGYYSRSYTMQH